VNDPLIVANGVMAKLYSAAAEIGGLH